MVCSGVSVGLPSAPGRLPAVQHLRKAELQGSMNTKVFVVSFNSVVTGRLPAVVQARFRNQKAAMLKDVSFLSMKTNPGILFHTRGSSQLHTSLPHLLSHGHIARVLALDPSSGPVMDDGALKSGSSIVIVEAPPTLKTAEPMPMLRPNSGLIKPGDAGRIICRRPKDLWAVRFATGAYLIDRKYFKPLEIP